MSDVAEKGRKVSKFNQIKAEFKKIVWPTPEVAAKHTTAVVITSVILGLVIAVLDVVLKYGVDFLISL